jgi:ABC-type transport system involved in cytochrome bd biosynthesis, ATPase and permease components
VLPTGGTLSIGEANLVTLSESVTGQRLAYVGPHVPLINGSIRDNLLYPLRHRPLRSMAPHSEEERRERAAYVFEAERSGNSVSHLEDDWVDYEAAGVDGATGFRARAQEILDLVELGPDLQALGLKGTVNPEMRGDLAARILDARRAFRQRLAAASDGPAGGAGALVETFDQDRYNHNMSVAENLLFGLPIGAVFDLDHLGDHPYVQRVLDRVGMREDFFEVGYQVAKIMVDLLSDLEPGHDFFDRFSFISSEDLPRYQAAVRRVEAGGLGSTEDADRNLLSSLPFRLIPARHRLGLIDETMTRRVLDARRAFAEGLPDELRGAVAFFEPDAYNPAASVQDNILFGKLVYGRPQAQREIGALIARLLEELDLRHEIVDLGLDFDVGIGGSRLSAGQRQKLGMARALIKRPDLLIFDHATSGLDAAARDAILGKLLQQSLDAGVVWVTGDVDEARRFEMVITMEGGRVVELGPPDRILGERDSAAAAN